MWAGGSPGPRGGTARPPSHCCPWGAGKDGASPGGAVLRGMGLRAPAPRVLSVISDGATLILLAPLLALP